VYIEDYRARLLRWAEAVRAGLESGADEAIQVERLRALAATDLGPVSPEEVARYQQASSVEMNWQGLARYWRKRAESGAQ
jgi:hypothetical protein